MACMLPWLAAALLPLAEGDLTVLAIGDWGGGSDEEPATESQRLTALGMTGKAQELGANFTLLMGDNFYQHGIHESADTTTRFRDTFEAVYATLLPGHPFYAFAGNHDYGEGRLANVSAQLAYSQMSQHWHFPSLWYKIRREFNVGNESRVLEVVILDTVVLCGNSIGENEAFIDEQLRFLGQQPDPMRPGALRKAVAEEQWAWLEARLRSSDADFLWVTGHYPIWSAGNDGPTPCLIERLRPLLMAHGAQYISGHDHMLEHFRHKGLDAFVVGAGKECCYPPLKLRLTPPGALRYMLAGWHGNQSRPSVPHPVRGGFASLQFTADFAWVKLHADDGATLYAAPPIPRRRRRTVALAGGVALQRVQAVPEAFRAAPFLLLLLLARAAYPRLRSRWSRHQEVATQPLLG